MIRFNFRDDLNFEIDNDNTYVGYGWSDNTNLSFRIHLEPYNSSFIATYIARCSLDHAIQQVEEIISKLTELKLV